MPRWVVSLIVLVLCVGAGVVSAQTDTPTPTPTASETPNVVQAYRLPTRVNEMGTPEPEQWAEYTYSSDAGKETTSTLLVLLVVSLWMFFLIWLLTRPRGSRT